MEERHHMRNEREGGLEAVKAKIPKFQGKNDSEGYLEWEIKMDQIFDYHKRG